MKLMRVRLKYKYVIEEVLYSVVYAQFIIWKLFSRVQTLPIKERGNKVSSSSFACE
jgi:hypothetical protein